MLGFLQAAFLKEDVSSVNGYVVKWWNRRSEALGSVSRKLPHICICNFILENPWVNTWEMADVEMKSSDVIDLTGDGGVLKEIQQEGTGEIPPNGYEIRGWHSNFLLSQFTCSDCSSLHRLIARRNCIWQLERPRFWIHGKWTFILAYTITIDTYLNLIFATSLYWAKAMWSKPGIPRLLPWKWARWVVDRLIHSSFCWP